MNHAHHHDAAMKARLAEYDAQIGRLERENSERQRQRRSAGSGVAGSSDEKSASNLKLIAALNHCADVLRYHLAARAKVRGPKEKAAPKRARGGGKKSRSRALGHRTEVHR